MLPTRRFGARWQVELSTASSRAPPRAAKVTSSASSRRRVTRSTSVAPLRSASLAAASPCDRVCGHRGQGMTEFRCTYRLQLTERLRLPRGARDCRPLRRRARRLAPLSLAVAAGPQRLDARLRRRRPDPHLRGSGRRGGVPLALRRGGRGGPRRAARHRSEPHGDLGGGEPVLARPGAARAASSTGIPRAAGTAASSTSATSPACGSRIPRCSRRRTRRCSSSSHDGLVDGLRIDHPDGLANPRDLSRAAARARRRPRLGREDPRARRAAARLARRGDDRLRVRERRHRALRRPRRRGADDAAVRRADRRAALVRGDRARGEARGGADDVRAGVRAAPFPLPARRARRGGGVAARLPHVRRAGERPRRRRRPPCAPSRCPRICAASCSSRAIAHRSSTSSSFAGSRPPDP